MNQKKRTKVSQILKVQELIDFYVLGEIQDEPRYVRQLDESMVATLKQGVNVSYMSRRIDFMHDQGYLGRYWDDDYKRYNHYCRISNDGLAYFKKMMLSVPSKVQEAIHFYQSLDKYVKRFTDHVPHKKLNESVKTTPTKVSRILKVEELIDFFVLGEVQAEPRYVRELDELMVTTLNRVGVNLSYMSRRIKSMHEQGFLERYWDDEDKHYNYYCKITDKGTVHFTTFILSVQSKVLDALQFYQALNKYVKKFGKMDLTK